jgi:hypothetical protein
MALAIWISFLVIWSYLAFIRFATTSVALGKYITVLPTFKVITLLFGASFWINCKELQMCAFWNSAAYINVHLIYETGASLFSYERNEHECEDKYENDDEYGNECDDKYENDDEYENDE